jgi:hypothetical protein
VLRAGVEGTGFYGAGLARFLTSAGVEVLEITRPAREDRRHAGKTDSTKGRDGIVESIRLLRIARQTAVKARTHAALQIRTIIVSAPDELRENLIKLKAKKAAERCATLRRAPVTTPCTPPSACRRQAADHGRRQPRPAAQRGRLRRALRHLACRGLKRQHQSDTASTAAAIAQPTTRSTPSPWSPAHRRPQRRPHHPALDIGASTRTWHGGDTLLEWVASAVAISVFLWLIWLVARANGFAWPVIPSGALWVGVVLDVWGGRGSEEHDGGLLSPPQG